MENDQVLACARSFWNDSTVASWHSLIILSDKYHLFYLSLFIEMTSNKITKYLQTLKKNQIRGAAQFCDSKGIQYTKTELAKEFSISRDQVQYALESDQRRTSKSSRLKAKD